MFTQLLLTVPKSSSGSFDLKPNDFSRRGFPPSRRHGWRCRFPPLCPQLIPTSAGAGPGEHHDTAKHPTERLMRTRGFVSKAPSHPPKTFAASPFRKPRSSIAGNTFVLAKVGVFFFPSGITTSNCSRLYLGRRSAETEASS